MAFGAHRSPSAGAACRRESGGVKRVLVLAAAFAVFGLAPPILRPASAEQTLNQKLAGKFKKKGPMVVEADRVVYSSKAHTISAEGDAQIYYEGKILEADRVVYYRDTGRVMAEGSVKLSEPGGAVTYARKMELSGDFKAGFVDALRANTKERTHMSATRSEKVDSDTTVFYKGTYTACPSCAAHPDRPPIWRLRADKITHKNSERMLYYENAWFEFYGVPIAYLPYFSAADPTVTRASGFLAPRVTYKSTTGFGFGTPYFWNIAPNMDVTLTPMYFTRQGAFGELLFRHRLDNGYYQIQVAGIHQAEDSAFPQNPWGAGDRTNRGEISTEGAIWLSQKWEFGWDILRVSDKWFLNDYSLSNPEQGGNFFRETVSTVYLTGQGDRGYFDLRGFAFQGMANSDYQPQLATVLPMLDYNKTIDLPPQETFGIGGQIEIDANVTGSSAALASYQQIGAIELDHLYGLHPVCDIPNVWPPQPDYNQQSCLLRGIGGQYYSGTVQLSWQRKFIDPVGEVWTPFAFARFNGNYLSYDTEGSATFGPDTISNADQSNFLTENNQFNGYVTPGVGMEWRYPLLADTPIGSLVIAPIGQIIARPNGQNPNTLVNLDAQSLVFDTSNLFEWNKYSGYDRFETGVRANYGAEFTLDMNKNGYVNAMFGQSAQVAGINSYATPDAANIGLDSGLNTPFSDYVARVAYSPNSNYTLIAKARFDQETWDVQHLDIAAMAHYGPLQLGVQFAQYQAQPEIGFNVPREGLQLSTLYEPIEHYIVTGNINFDLGRHYYNNVQVMPNVYPEQMPVFTVATWGVGGGYKDDCTKFMLNYTDTISDNYGYPARYTYNKTLLLTLELRTLGDIRAPIALSPSQVQNAVGYP